MSIIPNAKINPNIAQARSQATFDTFKLTYFLYEGPDKTRRKRFIQNIAAKETQKGGFKKFSELSREEIYEQALKKTILFQKQSNELNIKDRLEQNWLFEVVFPTELCPIAIHNAAFIPTITKLGTEQQKKKWLPLAMSLEVIGTYAQTELGHGTFLRGLETIATYDAATKEFIIDSPTITSTKFWPGGLGSTCNCCVVMAKLFVKGRDCGMQYFIVQIRDLDTHKPLPGMSIGDIGAKFGFAGMDNGYLRMDKVRIPRENMLMRYAQVLEDGTFVEAKNDRLLYGSMTLLRAHISKEVARHLAKVATIATRYSAVRFQSEINAGKGEVRVMDFQTQQHKLFVQIATSYALVLAGKRTIEIYGEISSQIEQGVLDQLPLLHGVTAGMKAFASWTMAHGIEQCRMACGGHGYLMASGIPKIYMNQVPACTYEGENTILTLQTARFVNKCFEAGQKGFNLPPSISFLCNVSGESKLTDSLELDHLMEAFEHRAAVLTSEANRRLQQQLAKGFKRHEAWNNSSQALCEAALAFCHAYTVRAFIESVQGADFGLALSRVMTQLCQLYAAHGITVHSGHFAKGGYMSQAQLDMVQTKIYDLLADLRPNAVALVDAFDFPDEVLDSAIGRYDGNVYEALMESAKNSKLNEKEVHDGIFKYVKPYVNQLKERNTVQARL